MRRVILVILILNLFMWWVPVVLAQWGLMDLNRAIPSCDAGADWLHEHNVNVCHRIRIIEEHCVVSTMECTIIPRPV